MRMIQRWSLSGSCSPSLGLSRFPRELRRKFAESLGCKPLNVVACFGQYDYVGIWDCPNEVAALKLAGCAVSTGDVQVQTLPALQGR
jgi:uncharacterized protein with GYD domain